MADGTLLRLARQFGTVWGSRASGGGLLALSPINVSVALAESPPPTSEDSEASSDTDDTSSATESASSTESQQFSAKAEKHFMRTLGEQVSMGGVLGFATGYSLRKIGKALMFVVGTEVVILQYMAYRGWVSVKWGKMAHDLSPNFNRSTWDKLLAVLLYKMPFNAAFTGGLLAGLRLTKPPS